jgi:peptidoglycan/LPS O-acetylase OafA/YrhL
MTLTNRAEVAAPAARIEHIPVLDSYRGLAALAVVATHVAFQTGVVMHGQVGAVLARLDVGVPIFFALSGFLLYQPWALAAESGSASPTTTGYLWRRALRILPAYWLVVIIALLAVPANQDAGPRVWLAQLSLTQNYVDGAAATALTQMWSLCAEVSFYLVLPALAWATGRLARAGAHPLRTVTALVMALGALNIGWVLWSQTSQSPSTHLWLPAFLSWFAVGMLLAAVAARRTAGGRLPRWATWFVEVSAEPAACLTVAGAVLLVSSTSVAGPRAFESAPTPAQALTKNLLYTVIALSLMIAGTLGPRGHSVERLLTTRPLLRLGEISYGVFLWHLLLMYVAFHVLGRSYFTGGFAPVLLLTLVLTVGVAALSWTVFERPVMRRLRSVVS